MPGSDGGETSRAGAGRRGGRLTAGADSTAAPVGLAIVDKPAGYTSHDVVARMRGIARTRRVGHAGTLDPMATGVLVLGLGKATRLLGYLALTEKEYLTTIRLGQTTVTDDAEGEVTAAPGASTHSVSRDALDAGVRALTGALSQVPAKVSAIKINGKRSYTRVREGEDVDIPARPVTVSSFAVHEVREETAGDGTPVLDVDATVVCSSGTYVRALARDLGAGLGVGGHLTALRRTRVGPYGLDRARALDDYERELSVTPIGEAAAAAFPRWDLEARSAELIAHGVRIDMPPSVSAAGRGSGRPVAVFDPEGRFLALVEDHHGKAKCVAVFV